MPTFNGWSTPGIAIAATAVLIFLMRVIDVSLGTVRMIMVMRGMRKWAVITGFIEVLIWVVAISQVINNLNNVINVLAYAGGFAAGTLTGMKVEDRLALGTIVVHIISRQHGHHIAESVRAGGYGATELRAEGHSGPVTLIDIVAPRKELRQILQLANRVDATAFVAVEDLRQARRGYHSVAK